MLPSLAEFIAKVKGAKAEGITSFRLPPEATVSGNGDGPPPFVPNDVYLEVRVRQMWLSNERELWRQFQPFLAIVPGFIHAGTPRTLPALLGSSQLSKTEALIDDQDAIEFRNIKVAGPVPYEGDDVSLLIALFRVETENWLARTLNAVEGIATAVSAGGLLAAKPVADTIIAAVTGFLGEKSMELRCGQYRAWSRAEEPLNPGPDDLRPGNYVVINRPPDGTEEKMAAGFTVRDGRLCSVEGDVVKPYVENDFVLIGIEARKERDDYKSLPFYEFWQETKKRLDDDESAAAERSWRKTLGAIYSDELTRPQQGALAAEYRGYYQELSTLLGGEVAVRREGAGTGRKPISATIAERDPQEIVSAAAR
jgi:hypothetical protein